MVCDTSYIYKSATLDVLEELVRTRIIVLRAANKLSDDADMSAVEKESREYYKRALVSEEHIAYLVYDKETFIGAGGVSFYQVMPTYHNPSGKKAYIMSGGIMCDLYRILLGRELYHPAESEKPADQSLRMVWHLGGFGLRKEISG